MDIKRGIRKIRKMNKELQVYSISFMFILFALTLFLFINIHLVLADSNTGNVTEAQAISCLNESNFIMNQMINEGFNVVRINDSIKEAQAYFDSQLMLKEKRRQYDFSKVLSYCDSIKQIHKDAVDALDSINALMLFYNQSIVPGMNTSTIEVIIGEIREDMDTERYEEISEEVNQAYSEISRVKASYTALNVFYDNTTRSLKKFFIKNWITITTLLVIFIVLFIVYRTRIAKWIIFQKIEKLKMRKRTIKELIMQVQKDYFQNGSIPEGEYNIKTNKFAELIRDIDRQIPLLQEELVKLKDKKYKE
jgi:hypothetical protein